MDYVNYSICKVGNLKQQQLLEKQGRKRSGMHFYLKQTNKQTKMIKKAPASSGLLQFLSVGLVPQDIPAVKYQR